LTEDCVLKAAGDVNALRFNPCRFEGSSSAGFSLWGLIQGLMKTRRLKHVPLGSLAPLAPGADNCRGIIEERNSAPKFWEGFMAATKLSEKEIAAGLQKLNGWSVVNGNLHRVFEFKDFSEAFGFMARVAIAAEKLDHHPDWSNSWNKVTVDLCTHSAGGLTKNDFELAGKMQQIQGG
jgi:4a-hydroxytetrahydrobiopterin dehydratase